MIFFHEKLRTEKWKSISRSCVLSQGQKQASLERNQTCLIYDTVFFFFNFSKYQGFFYYYLTKKKVNVFNNHSHVVCKVSTHFVVDIKRKEANASGGRQKQPINCQMIC